MGVYIYIYPYTHSSVRVRYAAPTGAEEGDNGGATSGEEETKCNRYSIHVYSNENVFPRL